MENVYVNTSGDHTVNKPSLSHSDIVHMNDKNYANTHLTHAQIWKEQQNRGHISRKGTNGIKSYSDAENVNHGLIHSMVSDTLSKLKQASVFPSDYEEPVSTKRSRPHCVRNAKQETFTAVVGEQNQNVNYIYSMADLPRDIQMTPRDKPCAQTLFENLPGIYSKAKAQSSDKSTEEGDYAESSADTYDVLYRNGDIKLKNHIGNECVYHVAKGASYADEEDYDHVKCHTTIADADLSAGKGNYGCLSDKEEREYW